MHNILKKFVIARCIYWVIIIPAFFSFTGYAQMPGWAQSQIRSSLFIEVETNKQKAFEGEPIIARYFLYVGIDLQGRVTKVPTYTGFAAYDLEQGNPDVYDVVQRDGRSIKRYLIKKVMLIGLLPGLQRLEPVELEATVRLRKSSVDDIGNMYEDDTVLLTIIRSRVIEIRIDPLPASLDSSFNGAIGSFKVASFLRSSILPVNKADTLVVTLTGSGNWPQIKAPLIAWPEGFETYAPMMQMEKEQTDESLQNRYIFSYPFTVEKTGRYSIPEINFSWFNTEKLQYQNAQSQPLELVVTQPVINNTANKNISFTDGTLLFSSIAKWLFPTITIILIVLLVVLRNREKKQDDENV